MKIKMVTADGFGAPHRRLGCAGDRGKSLTVLIRTQIAIAIGDRGFADFEVPKFCAARWLGSRG
jgi:hypothetical protein